MGRISGKTAVITGSASGIGEVVARVFAQEGARVILTDVDPKGEAVAASIREGGDWAKFRLCNVTQAEQVMAAMEFAVREAGRLDILVGCAGIVDQLGVVDTPEEVWDRVIAINLKGVFLTMKYAIPHMLAGGGGAIVTIGSMSAIRYRSAGIGDAYSASKGGVQALTNSVAIKYAGKGIRANTILPGPIVTPVTAQSFEEWEPRIPLRRLGTPADIAQAALFLASDESSFITAMPIAVDGGAHAAMAPSRRKTVAGQK